MAHFSGILIIMAWSRSRARRWEQLLSCSTLLPAAELSLPRGAGSGACPAPAESVPTACSPRQSLLPAAEPSLPLGAGSSACPAPADPCSSQPCTGRRSCTSSETQSGACRNRAGRRPAGPPARRNLPDQASTRGRSGSETDGMDAEAAARAGRRDSSRWARASTPVVKRLAEGRTKPRLRRVRVATSSRRRRDGARRPARPHGSSPPPRLPA